MTNEKASQAQQFIGKFIEAMEAGTLPAAIAKATISRKAGSFIPSDSWSPTNRIYMMLSNTDDARGFKQWADVGRKVKKGAKAFYIMAPLVKQIAVKDKDGNEEKQTVVYGFKWIPVFRYEDTDGEPLQDRPELNIPLPALAPVADAWGIRTTYRPFGGQYYGYYSHGREIGLATTDEQTFFHELAHAADDKNGTINKAPGQQSDNEIVAELSAAVLMDLYGRKANIGYTANYLKQYAGNEKQAISMIGKLIKRIDAAVNLIVDTADALGIDTMAAQPASEPTNQPTEPAALDYMPIYNKIAPAKLMPLNINVARDDAGEWVTNSYWLLKRNLAPASLTNRELKLRDKCPKVKNDVLNKAYYDAASRITDADVVEAIRAIDAERVEVTTGRGTVAIFNRRYFDMLYNLSNPYKGHIAISANNTPAIFYRTVNGEASAIGVLCPMFSEANAA